MPAALAAVPLTTMLAFVVTTRFLPVILTVTDSVGGKLLGTITTLRICVAAGNDPRSEAAPVERFTL